MKTRGRISFRPIDLWVFWAIIAILAAILFPAFALAHGTDHAISSAINRKHIASALIVYVQANDDMHALKENQTINVSAPGVLGNDVDTAGNPLAAILVTGPTHGTLSAFNANGSFTYTPNPGFLGTDTFTYKDWDATAGVYSNVATVSITAETVAAIPSERAGTVWTGHGDNSRDGAHLNETVLNTSNVNASSFGVLFRCYLLPSDDNDNTMGFVTQPLYVPNVMIDGAMHNVLYAGTDENSLYAFDADTGTVLWQNNYGPAPSLSDAASSCNCSGSGTVGMTGTPVIDTSTNTIYFSTRNHYPDGTFAAWIRAVDLSTGLDKFNSPQQIVPSAAAIAQYGSFDVPFLYQRAALTLANGTVYVSFASLCDCGDYRGWTFGYLAADVSNQQCAVSDDIETAPANVDAGHAGIWMAGSGFAADASGNLYFATGNGDYDGSASYGDSIMKMSPNLSVLDWFTPSNQATLNANDLDVGSVGVVLLPGGNRLVGGGKDGRMFLLDTSNMGQYNPSQDNVLEEFQTAGAGATVRATPAYYDSPVNGPTLYTWPDNSVGESFQYTGGLIDTTSVDLNGSFGIPDGYNVPLSISANGSALGTGIVWANAIGPLYAFDANTLNLLCTAGDYGYSDFGSKFAPPTIANGKVYVTLGYNITVLGLLGGQTPTPTALAATGGNAQITLNWTASSDATSYTVYRSTMVGGEMAPALASSIGTPAYTDTSVSNGVTYSYTVVANGSLGASAMSNEASATPLPPLPTIVQAASATPNPVAGKTTNLSALGSDIGGESTLTYTWSSTGPAAVTYSDNGDNTAKNTTATFMAAGSYVFTVTIADPYGQSIASQVTVTVNNPVFSSISVTPGPTLTLTAPATQQFTATALDQFGNPLATQPAFNWSLVAGSVGSLSTTGLYHSGSVPGSATVKAKSGAISGASSVTVNPPAVTVATAASAAPNPVTGKTTNLSVTGGYLGSGGVAALIYTWSSTGPASVTFSVNGTNAARNTTATFSQAGSYTLTATIAGPYSQSTTSTVNVTVNQTLTSIVISPHAVNLDLGGGDTFSAVAYDQFGTELGTQPAFTWSLGSGSVGSINASSGIYAAGSTTGTASVLATSGSVVGKASVTVNLAPVTVATAASATANPVTGVTASLSVLGAYTGPGGAGALAYTWSSTGPGSVTYSANGTNAAKNTTATFGKLGSYMLTATIASPYSSTTSSVNVVVNQTLTSITVTPGPTLTLGPPLPQVQQFAATGLDQFGNAMPTQPFFNWVLTSGVGSMSSTGLYHSGPTPGAATIKAKTGLLAGTCDITANGPPATVATAASATPNPVTGTSTNLSVLGAYSGPGGAAVIAYTWVETAGPAGVTFSANGTNAASNCTASFTQAGSYTLQATISVPFGASATSSVIVNVSQTLTTITVSPNSTTLNVNGGQTFTATANDQFGNALVIQPAFTWSLDSGSVGSINTASGLYAAGTVLGSASVRAASGSISGTASVSVIDPGPTVASIASANPNPVASTITGLSVLGADAAGEAALTYTWSSTGAASVSYSDNADNSAKNATATFTAAGAYVLTVTIANPYGGTVTSSVNVTVSQIFTSITVSPTPLTLNLSGGDTFTAVAYDQFGTALGTQPAFAWSLGNGSVGSINSATGVYAAGQTPGPATVLATSGSVTGTALVTVNPAPVTVTVPASATPNPVTGTSTSLSALGAYSGTGGAGVLTYTWSSTGPGSVTYSTNGTNAAANTTATFTQAGAYTFTVTIASPYSSTTSSVNVTVNQTVTSISVSPGPTVTLGPSLPQTQQFMATATDQFGNALSPPPAFTWSLAAGNVGSISSSGGLYHSGTVAGSATVRAKSGAVMGTSLVTVN